MSNNNTALSRRLGLFQATVLNMIDMVGIGPFLTLSYVVGVLGGMSLYAWLAGAILSFLDAMIWSELGAAYPLAGGSYHFLKEAYGKNGPGKMFSFLYIWQTVIQAPLVAASAAIGFAQYLGYLVHLNDFQTKAVSGTVIILITFLLYRKIDSIGRLGVLLWAGVIGTLGWIIVGGIQHGHLMEPIHTAINGFHANTLLSFVFGQACVKSMYSYLGYYNVCHLGGEIKNPGKNIPRSMFLSIAGIAVLYILMNLSVTSVIPWQEIQAWSKAESQPFVLSVYFERLYGFTAAKIATVMILWVALASLFAVMLGYSRVPFAAAQDGAFFKVFGRLHPTKLFPAASLLILAALAFIFSLLLKMETVIKSILAMRIIVQFIGQAIGVILLRKRNGTAALPYKMPLYPVPIVLAVAMWLFVFFSTGNKVMGSFFIVVGSGLTVYLITAWFRKQWPFGRYTVGNVESDGSSVT